MSFSRLALLMSMCTALGACSTIFGTQHTASAVQPSGSDNASYLAGKRHLAAGANGLAIDDFHAALALNPDSVSALNGIAIAYAAIGRNDLAQEYFTRALTSDPYSAVTLNNTAHFDASVGNMSAARFYASRALIVEQIAAADPANATQLASLLPATKHNLDLASNEKQTVSEPAAAPIMGVEIQPASVEAANAGIQPLSATAPILKAVEPEPVQVVKTVASNAPAQLVPVMTVSTDTRVAQERAGRFATGPQPKVRVSNGVGFTGLAENMARYLSEQGVYVSMISNEPSFDHTHSVLYYNPGLKDYAVEMARRLPMHPRLMEASQGTGEVELVLGADASQFSGLLDGTRSGA